MQPLIRMDNLKIKRGIFIMIILDYDKHHNIIDFIYFIRNFKENCDEDKKVLNYLLKLKQEYLLEIIALVIICIDEVINENYTTQEFNELLEQEIGNVRQSIFNRQPPFVGAKYISDKSISSLQKYLKWFEDVTIIKNQEIVNVRTGYKKSLE